MVIYVDFFYVFLKIVSIFLLMEFSVLPPSNVEYAVVAGDYSVQPDVSGPHLVSV